MIDILALILFMLMLAVFAELILGFRKVKSLEHIEAWTGTGTPSVSVIVPACNEETSIAEALRSLCLQEYTNLEVIVVDDRSIDSTAEMIEAVCLEYPQVKTIHIEHLPEGWLGKPHALQRGAELATGEFLLFCDADVCLEQTTISRAIRFMSEKSIDHLSLTFKNKASDWLLNTLIMDSGAGLMLLFKPWKVHDPRSRYFIGIGAFNMVRKSVYRAIGGHEQIRMQVIDDIFLGKLVKENGFKQECLRGENFVSVAWYFSIFEMVSGLMKNVYALFYYRPVFAMAALLIVFLAVIVPYIGIVFATGPARVWFLGTALIRVAGIGSGMVANGLPLGALLFLPVTPFISIYIIAKAMWTVHAQGGVIWRDTFYALSELRKTEWLLAGLLTSQKKI